MGGLSEQQLTPAKIIASAVATGDLKTVGGQSLAGAGNVGVGALVLLSTVTAASSATMNIETTFDSTYDDYLIVGTDLLPSSDGNILQAIMKHHGAYDSNAAYYYHAMTSLANAATYVAINGVGVACFNLGKAAANTSDSRINFEMRIFAPVLAATRKNISWSGVYTDSTTGLVACNNGAGTFIQTAGAMQGIRFFMSTGNIASGKISLFGISK